MIEPLLSSLGDRARPLLLEKESRKIPEGGICLRQLTMGERDEVGYLELRAGAGGASCLVLRGLWGMSRGIL